MNKAKEILLSGEFTCVLCGGDDIITSTLRGVKPLVQLLESRRCLEGYSAADKVVGRATAFLYLLLGVTSIYAHVISRPALELLQCRGVAVEYETLTDNIINRQGNGICPFEAATLHVSDEQEAYTAIRNKMKEMNIELK
ncbi:MAG: DUF1893 domain-containing protein [Clostridia bacterium]|nr:DUF1893 domain-containing protein [Clostridia bacterium]